MTQSNHSALAEIAPHDAEAGFAVQLTPRSAG
jgi:hypothetical protein